MCAIYNCYLANCSRRQKFHMCQCDILYLLISTDAKPWNAVFFFHGNANRTAAEQGLER